MSFFSYFVCVLLRVDSVRGGLSEGNRIFWFFFDFEPKKCFRVLTSWGLYGAEWDEHCRGGGGGGLPRDGYTTC